MINISHLRAIVCTSSETEHKYVRNRKCSDYLKENSLQIVKYCCFYIQEQLTLSRFPTPS